MRSRLSVSEQCLSAYILMYTDTERDERAAKFVLGPSSISLLLVVVAAMAATATKPVSGAQQLASCQS